MSVYPVSINKRSVFSFDLIYSNVWYAPLASIYGHWYFVTFVDHASRRTWVFLLKSKGEILNVLKTYYKNGGSKI